MALGFRVSRCSEIKAGFIANTYKRPSLCVQTSRTRKPQKLGIVID